MRGESLWLGRHLSASGSRTKEEECSDLTLSWILLQEMALPRGTTLKLVCKGQDWLGSLERSGAGHVNRGVRDTGQAGAWLDSVRR